MVWFVLQLKELKMETVSEQNQDQCAPGKPMSLVIMLRTTSCIIFQIRLRFYSESPPPPLAPCALKYNNKTTTPRARAAEAGRRISKSFLQNCCHFSPSVNRMAEQALKKLEEQLQCSICLDTYTDPKQLHCNHVYCQKCLVRMVIRDQQGQLTLTCPICRHITPVPTSGVAGLQSAFHINHLLEIQDSFKKLGDAPATSAVEGAVGSSKSQDPVIKHCFEHQEELRLLL